MKCLRKVTDDLFWIGASDRRLSLFENVFPIPRGVSYNSYLLLDEKTVLLDTVDLSVSRQFYENLTYLLDGKTLDYLIVNHMEPDHCANIEDLTRRYPDIKIVGNAKTMSMIKQFFDFDIDKNAVVIAEGDELNVGKHTLQFFMAPMVHWPEAMVTYEKTKKILFSADGFGTFGALNGNIFNDEIDFDKDWLDDARRYYTNIVGKYGPQVQSLLKKASTLDIEMICPLHGPIWRNNLSYIIEKYDKWSKYEPEDNDIMIVYGSMYGNTENVANLLATSLAEKGIKNIKVYDASNVHVSYLVSEAFCHKNIVVAAPTYNGGIFQPIENFLLDLKAHNLQNRTFALIENGTWAPLMCKQMGEILSSMKNINILDNKVTIKSSIKDNQLNDIEELANALLKSL